MMVPIPRQKCKNAKKKNQIKSVPQLEVNYARRPKIFLLGALGCGTKAPRAMPNAD